MLGDQGLLRTGICYTLDIASAYEVKNAQERTGDIVPVMNTLCQPIVEALNNFVAIVGHGE